MAGQKLKETLGPLFVLVARLTLVAVFLFAAIPKLRDPAAFAESVQAYRLTGPALSAWVALFLPWLELVAALGLLLPALRRGSGGVLAVLLLAFISLHAGAWARGLDISCGCFGAEGMEDVGYPWLLLRNAALLGAALLVLVRDSRESQRVVKGF